jgi:RNA polymerase sigma-70 factor (ECF subfamily)
MQEQKQFLAYYEEYRDKIYSYLYYRVGYARGTAEDLAAEVFLSAFDNFASFDERKGKFGSWIYRIAHNRLVNYYRETSGKQTLAIEYAEELPAELDAAAKAATALEVERILATLVHLKPEERDLLLLKYQENLCNEELADVYHKAEGAIRTALCRAESRLREIYLKLYPDE